MWIFVPQAQKAKKFVQPRVAEDTGVKRWGSFGTHCLIDSNALSRKPIIPPSFAHKLTDLEGIGYFLEGNRLLSYILFYSISNGGKNLFEEGFILFQKSDPKSL